MQAQDCGITFFTEISPSNFRADMRRQLRREPREEEGQIDFLSRGSETPLHKDIGN